MLDCKCGGLPMEQQGMDFATKIPIHRVECCSCHMMTLWHNDAKCARCKWDEMQEVKDES